MADVKHIPTNAAADDSGIALAPVIVAVSEPPPVTTAVTGGGGGGGGGGTIASMPDEKKQTTTATVYQELSLHLNAPDKFGVAFQLGGLMALDRMRLLPHVRFVHGAGYSNFIVAQLVLAAYAKAGYPAEGSDTKFTGWTSLVRDFKPSVVDPIIDHLLLVDQESTVACRRLCRMWKWGESWNRGFEDWYREDWPDAARLGAALKFTSINRNESPATPVFVMASADPGGGTATATDRHPPVTNHADDNVDSPGNVTVFNSATTLENPRAYLIASVFGGPYLNAVISNGLPMDPLLLYPYETYSTAQRGPRGKVYNDRCVILDAFSRSYTDRKRGVQQKMYTELQVIKITEARIGTGPSRPNGEYTDPPALYRNGYVRMHPRDRRPFVALDTASSTPVSMVATNAVTMKQLINWGYSCTMKQFGEPLKRADDLPYPNHNEPALGIESGDDREAELMPVAPVDVDLAMSSTLISVSGAAADDSSETTAAATADL